MHAPARMSLNDGLARLLARHSLEITAKDGAELPRAATSMAPGTRVSVTFLPKEGFGQRLAAIAEVLQVGMKPVPHIAARRITSEDDLDAYLSAFAALGACEELFIIAGDLDAPQGPYGDALAVIESGLLERHGVRNVGIGGYPEGHPRISDELLWQALRDKAAAVTRRGMDVSIMTQFGFDADAALSWLAVLRSQGIDAPVRLGVPGPASAATLMRFAARCGVAASTSVLRKYGLSLTRLMQSAGPDKYLEALAAELRRDVHGDVGLHFYPFGGLAATAAWISDFAAKHPG